MFRSFDNNQKKNTAYRVLYPITWSPMEVEVQNLPSSCNITLCHDESGEGCYCYHADFRNLRAFTQQNMLRRSMRKHYLYAHAQTCLLSLRKYLKNTYFPCANMYNVYISTSAHTCRVMVTFLISGKNWKVIPRYQTEYSWVLFLTEISTIGHHCLTFEKCIEKGWGQHKLL